MARLKTGRHTGAQKTARQAHRHMLRNRAVKRRIRDLARRYAEAAARKETDKLPQLMNEVASAWDKAAKTGAVHWKAAARKKARLARLARKALAAPAAPAASAAKP